MTHGDKIYSANCGDSRAILISEDNYILKIRQLTRDHKPDLELEKKRILSCGGYVEPFIDDTGNFIGPDRVWAEKQDVPGLAMSRSLGD